MLVVVLSLVGSYDVYRYLTQSRYKQVKTAIEPSDYEFIANRQGLVISSGLKPSGNFVSAGLK